MRSTKLLSVTHTSPDSHVFLEEGGRLYTGYFKIKIVSCYFVSNNVQLQLLLITLSESILFIRDITKTSSYNSMAYWLQRKGPESKPQLAVICNVVSSRIPQYLKPIPHAAIFMHDSNICFLEISGNIQMSNSWFSLFKGNSSLVSS